MCDAAYVLNAKQLSSGTRAHIHTHTKTARLDSRAIVISIFMEILDFEMRVHQFTQCHLIFLHKIAEKLNWMAWIYEIITESFFSIFFFFNFHFICNSIVSNDVHIHTKNRSVLHQKNKRAHNRKAPTKSGSIAFAKSQIKSHILEIR